MSLEQESLERVLVLSENTILCEGLKGIARKVISWNLVGECAQTNDLMQEVQRHAPTILLVGLTNGYEKELHAVGELAIQRPGLVILVLDNEPTPDKLLKFLQVQARGYFSIDVDPVELATAATVISARLFIADAALAERFSARQLGASLPSSGRIGHYTRPLTSREQETVQLLAMGMTNQQIADTFNCSLSTVKNRLQRLFAKLGVKNRLQAALFPAGRSNGYRPSAMGHNDERLPVAPDLQEEDSAKSAGKLEY